VVPVSLWDRPQWCPPRSSIASIKDGRFAHGWALVQLPGEEGPRAGISCSSMRSVAPRMKTSLIRSGSCWTPGPQWRAPPAQRAPDARWGRARRAPPRSPRSPRHRRAQPRAGRARPADDRAPGGTGASRCFRAGGGARFGAPTAAEPTRSITSCFARCRHPAPIGRRYRASTWERRDVPGRRSTAYPVTPPHQRRSMAKHRMPLVAGPREYFSCSVMRT
jgi:hypothetical protein